MLIAETAAPPEDAPGPVDPDTIEPEGRAQGRVVAEHPRERLGGGLQTGQQGDGQDQEADCRHTA